MSRTYKDSNKYSYKYSKLFPTLKDLKQIRAEANTLGVDEDTLLQHLYGSKNFRSSNRKKY